MVALTTAQSRAAKVILVLNSCRTASQVNTAKAMVSNYERMHGPSDLLTRYLADVETEQAIWQSLIQHRPL